MKCKFRNDSMPSMLYSWNEDLLYCDCGSYRTVMRRMKRNTELSYVGSGTIAMDNLLKKTHRVFRQGRGYVHIRPDGMQVSDNWRGKNE